MAKRKDPSVTFLNKFGYNVIKEPRVGIEPMDVIGSDRITQWLGPLQAVWKSSVAEPTPGPPNPAAGLAGQQTDQLDLAFGIKILANALAAFGANVPSVDFAYNRARKVQFSYSDVESTSIAPIEAGNYLAQGTLNTENPVVKHYFLDGDAEAFLIVEVLKSASITVSATDSHGASVAVDVPAIQGVVGTNVSVKAGGAGDNSVTYTGKVPLTFGFRVDRIQFGSETQKWSLSGEAPSGSLAFAAIVAGGPAPVTAGGILIGTGCRVSI